MIGWYLNFNETVFDLFSRLFDWLVDRINKSIASQSGWNTIGVLDIFGFEFFDVRSGGGLGREDIF